MNQRLGTGVMLRWIVANLVAVFTLLSTVPAQTEDALVRMPADPRWQKQMATRHDLTFELRLPKSVQPDPMCEINLLTDGFVRGTPLKFMKQRVEDEFRVFQYATPIFRARKRAVAVRSRSQPAQVFILPNPEKPQSTDWTAWIGPSYTETTDPLWTFGATDADGRRSQQSTNIPPNSFQLRYRIDKPNNP